MPGEIRYWQAPITGKPAGPAAQTGGRLGRLELRRVLGRVESAGTSNADEDVSARIINPDRRLTCVFGIVFEPDTTQAIDSFGAAAVWSPRGLVPGGNGGKDALLHELQSNFSLPRMYELESALPGVYVPATIAIPLTAAAAAIPGAWVLLARWSPNQPICEDELTSLYGACAADVVPAASPLAP